MAASSGRAADAEWEAQQVTYPERIRRGRGPARFRGTLHCAMVPRIACVLLLLLLGACASTALPLLPDQPAVAQAVEPYAGSFRALGITRISSPGGGAMLRMETGYGDVYVRYPTAAPPLAFVMDIDATGARMRSEVADPAPFSEVFAAFAPEAIRVTAANNDFGWARANPWR